jgi:hypothetical protein
MNEKQNIFNSSFRIHHFLLFRLLVSRAPPHVSCEPAAARGRFLGQSVGAAGESRRKFGRAGQRRAERQASQHAGCNSLTGRRFRREPAPAERPPRPRAYPNPRSSVRHWRRNDSDNPLSSGQPGTRDHSRDREFLRPKPRVRLRPRAAGARGRHGGLRGAVRAPQPARLFALPAHDRQHE